MAVTVVQAKLSRLLTAILYDSGIRKFWMVRNDYNTLLDWNKDQDTESKVISLSINDERLRAVISIVFIGLGVSVLVVMLELGKIVYLKVPFLITLLRKLVRSFLAALRNNFNSASTRCLAFCRKQNSVGIESKQIFVKSVKY